LSVGHNEEADFAASELARMFVADPTLCYETAHLPAGLSATASHEPSSSPWPKSDGLVSILETGGASGKQRDIAVEYKRVGEGIHGLLTAIGQAQGYLHKGYSGSAIVIPEVYPTHLQPGNYVRDVLNKIMGTEPVGVFCYSKPDTSAASPFAGRISCVRPIKVVAGTGAIVAGGTPKTQWVHMREGSTTRDAFFRFLQTAKRLSADGAPNVLKIPPGLEAAAKRLDGSRPPADYLANVADSKFLSRVWRDFWFEYIATPDVLTVWKKDGTRYVEPNAFTRIQKDDQSGPSQIWEGRSGSLKDTISQLLNERKIDEPKAWELFAAGISREGTPKKQGIRDRAHSYREDLDSSLAQLGWIDSDGYPTDAGYRYMNICERFGGANSDAAIEYVGATLLQAGHYASFLHYIYRLSEAKFNEDPLAFTRIVGSKPVFRDASYTEYLEYLEDKLSNDLKVMRKVSGRERPRHRTPFQAELTLLRNYGFVSTRRYRLGVGIPIDWERVLKGLEVEL
jgi:hypothetical protein